MDQQIAISKHEHNGHDKCLSLAGNQISQHGEGRSE